MIIRVISSEDTYPLRHKILRPHRPYLEIVYDTDHELDTFHIGAYINGGLVGIVSFNKDNLEDFPGAHYRLRAMAVLPEYRKNRIGRKIVEYGISLLKEKSVNLVWCKGRVNVQGYYEQIGFMSYGETFDYPDLGAHIILYKELRKSEC